MLDIDLPLTQAVQAQSTELRGVLERIVFPREGQPGTGFIIAKVRVAGSYRVESVKGTCLAPQIGAPYRFTGKWEPGKGKYGPTFAFDTYALELPSDPPAIVQYLMSAAKWIGPVVGEALVDAYGSETMTVLKNDPERVAREIDGITARRALEIQALLLANEHVEAVQMGLTDLFAGTGLGKAAVSHALQRWQHEALAMVQDNPFNLLELPQIGFKLADKVRDAIEMPIEDPKRIQAGIIHLLEEAAGGDGHTFLPDGDFRRAAGDLLRVPLQVIEAEFGALEKANHVHLTPTDFLGVSGYDIALSDLWEAEAHIADKLRAMLERPAPDGELEVATDGLADDQVNALQRMKGQRVFVQTGAPGTGKTFLVRRILSAFPPTARVALAAPTGKAAKRVSETTGQLATTIHRLLEPMPQNGRFVFTRNADNQLEVDVVILDECSMIDARLMAAFLDALPLDARLILIGDTNQLPPVGAGNVLRDIIASGMVETVELRTIKRQDAGLIIRNCHAIRDGRDISYENNDGDDFLWDEQSDEENLAATLVELVARRLPQYGRGYNPIREIQVITPLREKGELSCKALNKRLQAALNPNKPDDNSRFAPGDKVIQTRNDYELEIYNGDIGILMEIDKSARTYRVVFEAPERDVTIKWPADIDLAYAITCHKFQGSEAPAIVIPIHRSQGPMILQRSWLYTAISRAREVCVGVGQFGETSRIIRRQAQFRRFTHLERFLRGEVG